MHKITLFILAAVFAVALAGQYYVPRAYYTIDAEGHESAHVPLRRLRRSLQPYPYANDATAAIANANSDGEGGARAIANANVGYGGWDLPRGYYGASKPATPGLGETRRQYGTISGGARSVSASTSVGVDGLGNGYYDQTASTN